MDKIAEFYDIVKKNISVTLATASNENVSMRLVSPVYYEGKILIFTAADSQKYRQLKGNPNCCFAAGDLFVEAKAEFLGATMLACNGDLRLVYCEKFPGAFEENMAYGGRDSEFILFTPTKIKGWTGINDANDENAVESFPFEINMA